MGVDTDQQLVDRVLAGNKTAFDMLVLRHQHKVSGLVGRFIRDQAEVEDVSQEAFIKAYRALPTFRGDSAFYTWLYRITSNTAKNYLISKKRKKELLETEVLSSEEMDIFDIPGGSSPEEILEANYLRELIFESLSNLPEDIRTAVSLREFDGLSYEEISEVLDCPIGTVRSRIFRGREIIQEKISPLLNSNVELIKGSKRI